MTNESGLRTCPTCGALPCDQTAALISPAGEVGKPLLGRYIAFNSSNEEGNAVLYPEKPAEGCYWTLIGSGPDHDQNRLAAEMVERLNAPRGMEG